jgi:hypothetical protein
MRSDATNRPLTAAQAARLEANDVATWLVIDWYEGVPFETITGQVVFAGAGPILEAPDGRLHRITPTGRRVALPRGST